MKDKKISDQLITELADLLQHKIQNGEFKGCEFLRQNELEKLLDVNRFTVRQVLGELTNRNVLEHIHYRGHRVREHSAEEREQITEARVLLELGAASQVLARIDAQGLALLTEHATNFAKALGEGDHKKLIKANLAFHQHYYSFCTNPFLCDLINDLREQGIRVSRPGWLNVKASEQARDEHFAMVEALQNKDLLSLKNLIYQHLYAWKKYVTKDQPA